MSDNNELTQRTHTVAFILELEAHIQTALGLTGADMGNIQLFDPSTGTLYIAASVGFDRPFLAFFGEVAAFSDSACGVTLATRTITRVRDVADSSIFAGMPSRDMMLDAGSRAVISTPILGETNDLLGVYSLHWRKTDPPMNFTEAELHELADKIRQTLAREIR